MTDPIIDDDPRMVRAPLRIKLEGDGVQAGRISAAALGETLMGLVDFSHELAKVGEYSEHGAPQVEVVATSPGSLLLDIDLAALGQWWATARQVLTGEDAEALNNLAGFVALAGEVVGFLVRKGRRSVTKTKQTADDKVGIELDGGEVIPVSSDTAHAIQSPKVQRAAKNLLSPLSHQGIENMTITSEAVKVTINAKQAASIPDPASCPIEDKANYYEAWVRFNRPDFGGDKWGVETPDSTFSAIIEDEDFLTQVDSGSVTLAKYSEFRVSVREEPYQTKTGQIRRHRYITDIMERRDGASDDYPASFFDEGGQPT